MTKYRYTACLSDIHYGDGSAADAFDRPSRRFRMRKLRGHLHKIKARPYLLGDIGDCLTAHSGDIIDRYLEEFDAWADVDAVFVPGNHDAAWGGKDRDSRPAHKLFNKACSSVTLDIAGCVFLLTHGHEADRWCNRPYPDADAITALFSARRARRHAKARFRYGDIAPTVVGKIGSLARRMLGRPSRLDETIDEMERLRTDTAHHVCIYGHTHIAGSIGPDRRGWHYNTGCCCGEEGTETFTLIDHESGDVTQYRWTLDCRAERYSHELRGYV
jgi:predicted phosphodiesterase